MADRYNFFESGHNLFRRCLKCPSDTPSCPACASDETCSLKAASCDACASTTCVKIGSFTGLLTEKKSTPIGTIVGGVVGAVVALAIVAYVLWRFCLRPRRQTMLAWESPEKRDQSTLHRSDRQSTRSAHSIASTVLTRASNVIQIAYIPGVTVRSPPESPGLIVPPVPSIPADASRTSLRPSPYPEQHFFMPGDLRDSNYSGKMSEPRISLAPSLQRELSLSENALVPPIPAQQAQRAQANIVSVKTGATTPGFSSVRNTQNLGNSKSQIVARNVTARPIEVKKSGHTQRVPTHANLARQNSKKSHATTNSEKSVPVFLDEKEVLFSPATIIDETPMSPTLQPQKASTSMESGRSSSISTSLPTDNLLGNGQSNSVHQRTNSNGLNSVIENAVNRAKETHLNIGSKQSRPQISKHDSGPFSDSNEVKENLL